MVKEKHIKEKNYENLISLYIYIYIYQQFKNEVF